MIRLRRLLRRFFQGTITVGTFAAAVAAAVAAYESAQATQQQIADERSLYVGLSCETVDTKEYRRSIPDMRAVIYSDRLYFVKYVPGVPNFTRDGHILDLLNQNLDICELTNYSRLPIGDVKLPLQLEVARPVTGTAVEVYSTTATIGGVPPAGATEFAVSNLTKKFLAFECPSQASAYVPGFDTVKTIEIHCNYLIGHGFGVLPLMRAINQEPAIDPKSIKSCKPGADCS